MFQKNTGDSSGSVIHDELYGLSVRRQIPETPRHWFTITTVETICGHMTSGIMRDKYCGSTVAYYHKHHSSVPTSQHHG